MKKIPESDLNYLAAQEKIVEALIKLSSYGEAMAYLYKPGFQRETANKLYNQLEFHRKVFYQVRSHTKVQKRRSRSIPPPIPDNKSTAYVLIDIMCNPHQQLETREIAAKNIKNPDVIKENTQLVLDMAKSQSKNDKLVAMEILGNYLFRLLKQNHQLDSNAQWPDTLLVNFLNPWMKSIIASGDKPLKHKVIKYCKMIKDKTCQEILLPLFWGSDGGVVKSAIKAIITASNITVLENRYKKARTYERRNLADLFRRRSKKTSLSLVTKLLDDPDWVIKWWAENELINWNVKPAYNSTKKPQNSNTRISNPNSTTGSKPLHTEQPNFSSKTSNPPQKNVILVSIDMLRADKLGCYGLNDRTSPYLDRFSKQYLQFSNVISEASWTLPSHVSMLTSTYPNQHKVHTHDDYLGKDHLPLAEILKKNGYLTLALIGLNPNVSKKFGLEQGFDLFENRFNLNAAMSMNYLIRWIKYYKIKRLEGAFKKPFFFFLHLNDVHDPYPYEKKPFNLWFTHRKNDLKNEQVKRIRNYVMYHSMVYYVDQQLGRLFNVLREENLEKDFLIVIASDHGEAFGEHTYFSHGRKGYNEELSVPLFIYNPEMKYDKHVHDFQVQLVDILPTILGNLKIPPPKNIAGHNLIDLVAKSSKTLQARERFSETIVGQTIYQTLFVDDYKYIVRRYLKDNVVRSTELYDLLKDPAEKKPIPKSFKTLHDKMNKKMEQFLLNKKPGKLRNEKPFLDEDTLQQLRKLGYLE